MLNFAPATRLRRGISPAVFIDAKVSIIVTLLQGQLGLIKLFLWRCYQDLDVSVQIISNLIFKAGLESVFDAYQASIVIQQ
jgi:hypothetical protein